MPPKAPADTTATAQPASVGATTLQSPSALEPTLPDAPFAPGTRLGRYEVEEAIGSGGMGMVYRARDVALERPLAIKVLHAHATSARAQVRLLDEARAMAKLRHPAVVPVFDVGRVGRAVYVVMPLVTGGTLHDWLTAARRPWCDVLARFLAAGRGLAAAHAAGVVHRDFKPRNVLVDADGAVMVGDFGIAAHGDSGDVNVAVAVSTVAGTPAYMAPEQARGETIDARADQYSFCVSLWEGLHGARPQEAVTRTGTEPNAVASPRPRGPLEGVPTWLVDALQRGLKVAPADRWPSMRALLDHLEQRLASAEADGEAPTVRSEAVAAAAPPVPMAPVPTVPTRRRVGVWIGVAAATVTAAVVAAMLAGGDQPTVMATATASDAAVAADAGVADADAPGIEAGTGTGAGAGAGTGTGAGAGTETGTGTGTETGTGAGAETGAATPARRATVPVATTAAPPVDAAPAPVDAAPAPVDADLAGSRF